MKKIIVKPIFGAHQIYQEIINYPPEGIEYPKVSQEIKQGKYYKKKKLNEFLGSILQKFSIPRMIFAKSGKCDIIHSSRGIIPLNKKPWIMDIEHVHSFFGLNPELIRKKIWKKFIEKKLASKYCKAILCHCEATRQSFFHYLDCKKFKNKLEILYPSSHLIPLKKEKHKKIRILCILSLFEYKGGMQVLEAFKILEKKYKNIELWMRSDVPKKIKEKYNSKNIKYTDYFGNIIPRRQLLQEVYSKCDIFLYPTFCDSFGYSLIDALVAGLPIIGTNLFAVPEIVEDGKNGFIVNIPKYQLRKKYEQFFEISKLSDEENKEFIMNLVKVMEKLIKNKKMRVEMGKESFRKIKNGKFSIKKRNGKLKKIYEEALGFQSEN